MPKGYLLFCLLLLSQLSLAQGIRGKVYTAEQETLAFATIFIPSLETGTSTNEDGSYEIKLKPGSYELVFQYLGYQTVVRQVQIGEAMQEMNVTMPLQTIQLKEVQVRAAKEDPAYTIMRKAIAKAKFHTLQVQSYTAQVYTKGAGQLKKAPFFLRKPLEKEGVDTSTLYLTESVSEITFEQPNTLKEKVISIRTIGEDNSTSPNSYINGSFYQPEIAGVVSPLSPRAFAHYKFRFEGSFFDRDHEVNKIRVIPRSKGDNVFSGLLYIVEDEWSIHSLNLVTYKQGIRFTIKQIYAPVEEVWMPVTHRIEVDGKILGFAFAYDYLATVSDYDITINPDLKVDVVVIDEKTDQALADALQKEEKLNDTPDSLRNSQLFRDEQRLTRKELRKTLRKYEKELDKQEEAPEVVANTSMRIDSTAYRQDSSCWARIRPVPLNTKEIKSYQKLDSTAVAEKEEEQKKARKDSVKTTGKSSGFKISDLVLGTTVKLGKRSALEYASPLLALGFNTVEGIHFNVPFIYRRRLAAGKSLKVSPTFRYAFARNKLIGKLQADFDYSAKQQERHLRLEGGRFVCQFNEEEPIAPVINAFYTLFYKRNYLKLYEKDYIKLSDVHQLGDPWRLEGSLEWSERHALFNNTDYTFNKKRDEEVFSPNAPENVEVETGFPLHQAFIATIGASWQPFLKYRVRDGKKQLIDRSSPTFRLKYRKAFPDIFSGDVDFDQIEIGVKDQVKLGIRGRLDYNLYAGSFLNRRQLYFMDFQHFMGNRTVLQVSDPVGSFRLLDYYRYSTAQEYLAGHVYYQFRKLLLTQIFAIRMLGLKENLVLNYLKTGGSPHYLEAGYSLDNIFRILRLEAIASFADGKYQDVGFRVGISADLQNLVSF